MLKCDDGIEMITQQFPYILSRLMSAAKPDHLWWRANERCPIGKTSSETSVKPLPPA
jgi:hypothetical protein